MSLLIINSLISLSSLIFFTIAQTVIRPCEGLVTGEAGLESVHSIYGTADVEENDHTHAVWSHGEDGRIIPGQLSCLAIFALSVVLLASAWLDFRDDESLVRRDNKESMSEKGEIYL